MVVFDQTAIKNQAKSLVNRLFRDYLQKHGPRGIGQGVGGGNGGLQLFKPPLERC